MNHTLLNDFIKKYYNDPTFLTKEALTELCKKYYEMGQKSVLDSKLIKNKGQ